MISMNLNDRTKPVAAGFQFHERLTACLSARNVGLADETTFYLVELLASAGEIGRAHV